MRIWQRFDIYFILIAALVIRLISLNQSLWLDEAINVVAAKDNSFLDFIFKYPIGDFHPPGYFILLWIWTHLFGFSEVVVRLPSVLLGVGSVYLTFLTAKELFKTRVGILAAIFMAVAPLHIYYSQEARMYSLSVLAVTLSFYCLVRLLNNQRFGWWGYLFSVSLVIFSDYVAILSLPVHLVVTHFFDRQKTNQVFGGLILAGLFYIPWVGLFLTQIQTGTAASHQLPAWASVVGGAQMKQLGLIGVKTLIGRISFEPKLSYILAVSAIGLGNLYILKSALSKIDKKFGLLICWLLLPIGLAFLISLKVPILSYFRVIFVLPAYYILLALGISKMKPSISKYVLVSLILVSIVCAGVYLTSPKFQREDWRGAVKFLNSHLDKIIVFEDNNVPSPFKYYDDGRLVALAGLRRVPASSELDLDLLNLPSKIFLFDYLVEINDPNRLISTRLQKQGYKNSQTYNFNGVGFIREYARD